MKNTVRRIESLEKTFTGAILDPVTARLRSMTAVELEQRLAELDRITGRWWDTVDDSTLTPEKLEIAQKIRMYEARREIA